MNLIQLIAQSRVDELSMQFQHPDKSQTNWFLTVVVVSVPIVLGGLIAGLYYRQNRTVFVNDHSKMFSDLSQLHGVSYQDQKLLLRIAKANELAEPALIYAQRAAFDRGLESAELDDSQREHLVELRTRLFA